ncbi:MAG: hypothetical protein AB7H80_05040 [Candidatus Kapaibacterium sp.]
MMSRYITMLSLLLVGAVSFIACESTPSDPNDNPASQQMSFKAGSSYEYTSYSTDPSTAEKVSATERNRRLTLVNTSISAYGKTGVALYLDSILTLGGIVDVVDSVYLLQQSGTNDIFRYASVAPELDFSVIGEVDLGRDWMHEARLGSSSARWFVGSAKDTLDYDAGFPAVTTKGLELSVVDSVVASSVENLTIDGKQYATTKTTHNLKLALTILLETEQFGQKITVPLEVKSVTLQRFSWISAELGAVVREAREGAVIDATVEFGGSQQGVNIPVPGYFSEMTRVISN